uniref:PWWP domain-containing protein n=1 Tax=Acrobeloides nanus TaxID=290746 RepID=A0A914EHN9_9BILA
MGRRGSASQTNTPGLLKSGDIVWVPYRKSPLWPAIIKNVYPKKVTYCFLPSNGKSPIFKAMPKSVILFKESDPLPANASKDLKQAYNAALRIVRGETPLTLDIGSDALNNNDTHSFNSISPSTSTSSHMNSSSRSSSTLTMPASKKLKKNSPEPEHSRVFFRPDDIVMVKNESKGKWPALVRAIDATSACISLFPLEEPEVTRTILLTELCHLSFNEISFLCKQVEESNPELHKALLDVQHFLLFKSDDISAEKVSNMSLDDTVDTGNESTHATLNGNSYDMEMEEVEAKIVRTSIATSSSIPVRSRSESLDIKKNKIPFRDAMLTEDAREFMESIWNQKVPSERHNNYKRPISSNLEISFNCGDLLSYQELEQVVTEFQKWITLCTKLPKMSLLTELHYVSEVVLPEVCIYCLSKKNECSREKAEKLFRERSQKDFAFNQLLRAVSMERETMT